MNGFFTVSNLFGQEASELSADFRFLEIDAKYLLFGKRIIRGNEQKKRERKKERKK